MKLFLFLLFFLISAVGVNGLTADLVQQTHNPFYSAYMTNGSSNNLIGDYSGGAWGRIDPAPNTVIRLHRILISLVDTGINNADEYAAETALPNGIGFYTNISGKLERIDGGLNVTRNWEYERLAYDVRESDSFANGEDTVNIRWTFSNSGTTIRLNGSNSDSLLIRLSDDITIDGHYFLVQGYNETQSTIITTKEANAVADLAYYIGISIILVGAMFIIYKGSVDIPAQYWYLKMFMYMGSLGLMLAAINYGIQIATANAASTDVISSLDNFYQVSVLLTVVAISIVGLLTLKFILMYGLKLASNIGGNSAKNKNTESFR